MPVYHCDIQPSAQVAHHYCNAMTQPSPRGMVKWASAFHSGYIIINGNGGCGWKQPTCRLTAQINWRGMKVGCAQLCMHEKNSHNGPDRPMRRCNFGGDMPRHAWRHCRELYKMAEWINMPFWLWTCVGPKKHVTWGHIGTTWRIQLNSCELSTCNGNAAILSNYVDYFTINRFCRICIGAVLHCIISTQSTTTVRGFPG